MQDSKKGQTPFRHGISLSKEQSPKTAQEFEDIRKIPYASAVGSLMYAILCPRPYICFAVGVVNRFQSNPGPEHWIAIKHVLKNLRRTRNLMLTYSGTDLTMTGLLSIVPTRRVVVSIYVHLMSYSLTKTLACSCLFINKKLKRSFILPCMKLYDKTLVF